MMPFRWTLAASALALTVLAASPLSAQQAAPAAPAPAAPAASAPSPSHLAAARDLILASGAARSFDAVLPAITEQVRQSFSRQRPELLKDLEESMKAIMPQVEAQREEIIQAAARVYASKMTEAELKESAAFFKSATGQKYVVSQPIIFDELFTEMQNWMGRVSDFTVTQLRAEMKKRGQDI